MVTANDTLIARIAHAQHGCVTDAQMRAAGVSRAARARRVASGLLVPVGAATHRLASHPASPTSALMAACLDLDAVASHRSAAWLHGLLPRAPRTEVSVAKGRGTQRAGLDVTVHTSTNLPDEDVLTVEGIPTVSVARSLLGLAAVVAGPADREQLVATVETAVREGRASDPWLWWMLERRRCRGRNGVTELEAVLAARAELGPTESWLERQALDLLVRAGLPRPRLQRRIRRRGAFAARVDMVYEAERVVIEVLGHRWHSSRGQLEADTRRANDLQVQGYVVIQITYDQLVGDPASVLRTIRSALASRRAA